MSREEVLNSWITQKEASEILGKTLKSVNELVRNKRFQVNELYGRRLVLKSEILSFKPKKAGRPKNVK